MKRLIIHTIVFAAMLLCCGDLHASESKAIPGAIHPQRAFLPQDQIAADGPDTFAIVAAISGGYAQYIMPYTPGVEIDRRGQAYSLRLLWYPDHRLRMGLESGWTTLYSYELKNVETSFGETDASLSLSAVPLLAVFSMQIIGPISLSAGVGGYIVRSHAKSFDVTVDITRFSQGWMGAVAWSRILSFGPHIGVELKWYGATEFGDGVLTLQLQAQISIL